MLSDFEKQVVKELQKDLPLVQRPFQEVAKRLGISEDELLDKIKNFKERGILRRFGAAVRHQNLGYTANAMVVWEIPPSEVEKAGQKMVRFPEISHCYQRPTHPDWPYNLFTVVHGKTDAECREKAERIAKETGYDKYRLIFSTKELKKSSMRYFED